MQQKQNNNTAPSAPTVKTADIKDNIRRRIDDLAGIANAGYIGVAASDNCRHCISAMVAIENGYRDFLLNDGEKRGEFADDDDAKIMRLARDIIAKAGECYGEINAVWQNKTSPLQLRRAAVVAIDTARENAGGAFWINHSPLSHKTLTAAIGIALAAAAAAFGAAEYIQSGMHKKVGAK